MEAHHHGHHDMGGQPAGPIDRHEHKLAPWEKRTAAMMMVLQDPNRCLITADELRLGIEAIGADEYDRLTYYERWITSIANHLLQRGVFTVDELGRKLAEIEAREKKP